MLTTELHECGLSVFYDGHEFSIVPYAENLIGVYYERRGKWYEYMPGHTFRDFADVCYCIYCGTIAVDRTEQGHIFLDKFGNITEIVPLSYYERRATPLDLPEWAFAALDDNEFII